MELRSIIELNPKEPRKVEKGTAQAPKTLHTALFDPLKNLFSENKYKRLSSEVVIGASDVEIQNFSSEPNQQILSRNARLNVSQVLRYST